jgi:hypothetical protein
MSNFQKIILVEGINDSHVVGKLLDQVNLLYTIKGDDYKKNPSLLYLRQMEGRSKLLQLLSQLTQTNALTHLAVVMDADLDLISSWQAVTDRLKKAGQLQLPESPVPEGYIGRLEIPYHTIKIGLWLMPNNQQTGELEHFLAHLIPDYPHHPLWQHSLSSVAHIPINHRRFNEADQTKAELCTWLAWQDRPGVPYGIALREKYFDLNQPIAQTFISWLQTFLQP